MSAKAQARRRMVIGKLLENPSISIYRAMREVGYAHNTAIAPTKNLGKSFTDLLEQHLSDEKLTSVHEQLLNSKRIEHMTFPMGPRTNAEKDTYQDDGIKVLLDADSQGMLDAMDATEAAEATGELMSDEEIVEMIKDIGGTVRRIVHGRTARHVYFWAANDKSRTDALKLAYDVKGKLKPKDDSGNTGATYNTFIQQNNIDPNTPTNRELVDATVKVLMDMTKRKQS
jgi:hypothetical protein